MVLLPGGTFRMGSDHRYPEEAPAHQATVSSFWIDRTPVTNRQFREFVRATRHVTFAETVPDPKQYPDALPHLIFAGSVVFTPPRHPGGQSRCNPGQCRHHGAGAHFGADQFDARGPLPT